MPSALSFARLSESTRLREEHAKLREQVTQLQAQLRAQPAPPPPPADNVVPLDTARAAERAADERAWRNYTYGNGGGVLIAPGVNIDPRK